MTSPVITVEMDDKLSVVKGIFDHRRFHHLIVVEKGKLFGVVSDRDLLKVLSPNIGTAAETTRDLVVLSKRVHQIMTRHPVSLRENAPVAEAIDAFLDNRISCIPIVNADNEPIGIVSWRDVFAAMRERNRARGQ